MTVFNASDFSEASQQSSSKSSLRRPVVVKSKDGEYHNTITNYIFVQNNVDGVMGCEMLNGRFVEESNFHIDCVKMKIKLEGMEAGWIVMVKDVLGGEEQ